MEEQVRGSLGGEPHAREELPGGLFRLLAFRLLHDARGKGDVLEGGQVREIVPSQVLTLSPRMSASSNQ